MNTLAITTIVVTFLLVISYLLGRLHQRKNPTVETTDTISLYNEIQDVPAKVLAAIQGSINPQKGKMAELLTYAQIRYDYDVIIPLGQPIDFIGIKIGEKIDFIEVKSGANQLLSPNEAEIKKLIKNGNVNFRLLVVKDQELHQDN
jgi:hypothetical protein